MKQAINNVVLLIKLPLNDEMAVKDGDIIEQVIHPEGQVAIELSEELEDIIELE